MIKIENHNVYNLAQAVYAARNPMNSWSRSDSDLDNDILGENDLNLAKRLCNAGSDHRKFLRQIFVSVDITAPLYWWKEMDQYKVGTTTNSCSTMHKIHAKEFTVEDFSIDDDILLADCVFQPIVAALNAYRDAFNETKNKEYWRAMIQLLPSSYNQMRTCTLNYENLRSMYHSRRLHKLEEWREFCKWIETLPYAAELIVDEK